MFVRVKLLAAAATAAAFALAAGSANASLIVNGGFDQGSPQPPSGSFSTLGVGDTSMTGWTVTAGTVDWINGYWQSADGDNHSVDLNGLTPGGISQDVGTTGGQRYRLTFDMSANPDFGGVRLALAVAGADIGSFSFTPAPGQSRSNMGWQTESLDFTAPGPLTTVTFLSNSTDQCCYGAAIDNVAVNAVPEPATWAMMLLGFFGLGYAVRRRRQFVLSRVRA